METPAVAGAEQLLEVLEPQVPKPAEPGAEVKPSEPADAKPSEPAAVVAESSEAGSAEVKASEPAAVADVTPTTDSGSDVRARDPSPESAAKQDDKPESQQGLPEPSQASSAPVDLSPAGIQVISEEHRNSASPPVYLAPVVPEEHPAGPSDAAKEVGEQLKAMAVKEDVQQGAEASSSAGHDETGASGPPGAVPEPEEPAEKPAKKRRCIIA